MINKATALGMAGVAFLGLVIPVLAYDRRPMGNELSVTSETSAIANTGGNSQSNITSVEMASDTFARTSGVSGFRYISTGDATANASSFTIANTDSSQPRMFGFPMMEPPTETRVKTTTDAYADTGANYQDNVVDVSKAHDTFATATSFGGGSVIRTGDASSTARNTTLVNVRTFGLH